MVTQTQIKTRFDLVEEKVENIRGVLEALRKIRERSPAGQGTFPPYNVEKYRDYTNAEITTIYEDAATRLQAIKASL